MIDLNPFSPLIELGAKIIDKVIPDPQAKAQAQLELIRLQQQGELAELNAQVQLAMGQQKINEVEAASDGVFKGGWRPATGWICAAGLGYQMFLRPLLGWAAVNLWGWDSPPPLEMDTLLTLLFGMLGLGAYRTVEKVKGAAR